MAICSEPGCTLVVERAGPCPGHAATSSRNHRGVRRQQLEHGAAYDRLARELRGQPCALRLDEGCTGVATGADLIVPRSQGGRAERANVRPACLHCNSARGARS